jgi:hypothetical protein
LPQPEARFDEGRFHVRLWAMLMRRRVSSGVVALVCR